MTQTDCISGGAEDFLSFTQWDSDLESQFSNPAGKGKGKRRGKENQAGKMQGKAFGKVMYSSI